LILRGIGDACEEILVRGEYERKRGFLRDCESLSYKNLQGLAMEALGGGEGGGAGVEEVVRAKFEDG
jgi:hypothetical protein